MQRPFPKLSTSGTFSNKRDFTEMLTSLNDENELDELLKHPTSLPAVGVTAIGFASEQAAQEVGNPILVHLQLFGTYLELERLEGVTLAYDYRGAIAQVDRGGFKETLTPTQDDIAVGVAMAVNTLRDGRPMMHLVLDAGFMSFLKSPKDPNYGLALHILAHEASHVHDLARQDRAYPGLYGRRITDTRDAILFAIAHNCWEEYIASLLSAVYAPASQTANFELTFCSCLTGLRQRGNAYIRKYRRHADIMRLLGELEQDYGRALKYGAYLLGHIEGLEQTLHDAAPTASEAIMQEKWFCQLFDKFATSLRQMHKEYGKWSGIEVYEPLKETICEVLKAAGIEFQLRPEGNYYIKVPFSSETLL